MFNIEELDSQIFVLFEYIFHVVSFVVDGSEVSTGLGFVFELKIDSSKFKEKLKTLRSVPDRAKMNASEAFNCLRVDVLRVIFGVFQVSCFEHVIEDFVGIETTAEMGGHPEEASLREFGIDGYVLG